jgi:hypothetical protein
MSGFNEDERIRHKNNKFADSFEKKSNALSLVLNDVSLSDIVKSLKDQGFKITLRDDNVMVISGQVDL